MKKEIISFPGMFQCWLYTVSHGQLLLRRTKDANHPTRVDILFKPVEAFQLATTLHDPVIYQADVGLLPKLALAEVSLVDRYAYLIRAREFEGYIVAATVVWHEDEGEYHQPSALLAETGA